MSDADTQLARFVYANATDIAIVATDAAGIITNWSPGAERLFGWSAAAALGRDIAVLHVPEDRAAGAWTAARDEAAARGQVRHERWYLRADGTRFWGAGLTLRHDDERDGTPIGYVKLLRDWTERRRADEDLREREAQFRMLADLVPQIIWITDRTGRMEFLNRQFVDYTGASSERWSPAEMAGNFIHPDDGPKVVAAFDTALRTGTPFEIEHRIRSAAGEDRWFLARAEPHRDPASGAIVRWFGVSVDIHDRKIAEDRLRALNLDLERKVVERSRERGMIWRHSVDLLSVVDLATGTFDAVNPAWTDVLGWALADLEGRHFFDFVHPDDIPASEGAFAMVRSGRPVLKFDNRYRTADGGWRWLSWVSIPEGGKLYSVTRDVTEERERMAELEAAQAALRQSQKMEAMGSLTGGVAHDFNNLLTPIVGSLDLLQRKGLGSARDQRLIASALQSAERARTLVQRLLAFARRQPLQARAVDIGELVRGMVDLIASTAGPRTEVTVAIADTLPLAQADHNQLEMALLNLCVNACDAMPDGGRLTVAVGPATVAPGDGMPLPPGRYVRLSVADTGIGMDAETLHRAIEPFYSTKGIGKGTGLGLSMVHGLAAQLGGGLTIDSRPGSGTDVRLWLPVSEGVVVDLAPTAPAPMVLAAGCVLLVDDEEAVRDSIAHMLADLGYAVHEATSADSALRLIDAGLVPDLLVTDHLMPGISGTELARAVMARVPGVRVLVASGYAEVDGIAPDLPRLIKPFRQSELAARLGDLPPG